MNDSNSLYKALNSKCLDNDIVNRTVSLIKRTCEDDSLDFDKVAEEIIRVVNKVDTISSMYNFVKAVLGKLDKTRFGYVEIIYVPNTQPFINSLREKNITMSADDVAWLNVVWTNIVNNKGVESRDCMALNHKIISYMLEGNKSSFSDYKDLLKKSKALRNLGIDWDKLETKTKEFIEEWNKTLEEIGGSEYDINP